MATKTTKRPRSGIDELARRLKAIETRLSSLEANPKRPGKLRLGKSARQVFSDIARERSRLEGLAASPSRRPRETRLAPRSARRKKATEIGRASSRVRECQYV